MSDDDTKKNFFQELNQQIKAAGGAVPDTITIGGETFQRRGTAPKPKRGDWSKGKDVRKDVELVSITINVAPHSDRVVYNGVIYLANRTYDVPVDLAATLRDIISQTWKHENSTGGANSYGAGSVRNPAYLTTPGVAYGQ
jgi:hypothetical protein